MPSESVCVLHQSWPSPSPPHSQGAHVSWVTEFQVKGKTQGAPAPGPDAARHVPHVSGHSPHAPMSGMCAPELSVPVEHQRRSSKPSY